MLFVSIANGIELESNQGSTRHSWTPYFEANVDLHTWAKIWQQAGDELDRQRRREVMSANTAEAIESFSTAFQWAVASHSARPSSGLVQQQAVFSRLRER